MIKLTNEVRGDGFVWKGDASPSDYEKAKKYLQKSSKAAEVLAAVEDNQLIVVHLLITTDEQVPPNYYPYLMTRRFHTSPAGNLITWNPKGVLNVVARQSGLKSGFGKQSPAMALLHEMGHALQHFHKREWFVSNYNKVLSQDDSALLNIENDNITTYELPAAQELNEGVRYAYRDVGSTEYQVYSYA